MVHAWLLLLFTIYHLIWCRYRSHLRRRTMFFFHPTHNGFTLYVCTSESMITIYNNNKSLIVVYIYIGLYLNNKTHFRGKYAAKPEKHYQLETTRDSVREFLQCRTIGVCTTQSVEEQIICHRYLSSFSLLFDHLPCAYIHIYIVCVLTYVCIFLCVCVRVRVCLYETLLWYCGQSTPWLSCRQIHETLQLDIYKFYTTEGILSGKRREPSIAMAIVSPPNATTLVDSTILLQDILFSLILLL